MPRIIDAYGAFGASPAPQPTRGTQDIVRVGAGLTAAANTNAETAGLGSGFDILSEGFAKSAESFEEAQEKRAKLEVADADAQWTTGLIGLTDKYRDDQDFTTLTDRYKRDVQKLQRTIGGTLTTNEALASFKNFAAPDAQRIADCYSGAVGDGQKRSAAGVRRGAAEVDRPGG